MEEQLCWGKSHSNAINWLALFEARNNKLFYCREILEQYPLHFSFHDGKVLKLCPVRGEQTWALNIKRGILSVLQTAQEFPAGEVVEEVRQHHLSHALRWLLALVHVKSTPLVNKQRGLPFGSADSGSHLIVSCSECSKIVYNLHSCWALESTTQLPEF